MHKFEIFCKTIFNSPEPLTFDPGLYVKPDVTFFFLKMTMFDGARKCHKTTKVLSKTTQILQLFLYFITFSHLYLN